MNLFPRKKKLGEFIGNDYEVTKAIVLSLADPTSVPVMHLDFFLNETLARYYYATSRFKAVAACSIDASYVQLDIVHHIYTKKKCMYVCNVLKLKVP